MVDLNKLTSETYTELTAKSRSLIDLDTAWRWAARAFCAFNFSFESKLVDEKIDWFLDGEDYFHEALEHAATSFHSNEVEKIKSWVQPLQKKARNHLAQG